MYKRDVKDIVEFVNKDFDKGLERVVFFVIGTIRERFVNVERVTQDLIVNKVNAKSAWGNRRKAIESFYENKKSLAKLSDLPIEEATHTLCNIKGLGIAKSSFVLQLLGKNTACLDTHNLTRLGIPNTYFKKTKRIPEYIQLVQQQGSEYWWDSWCELIAQRYPKHFKDADHVSKLHAKAIIGE